MNFFCDIILHQQEKRKVLRIRRLIDQAKISQNTVRDPRELEPVAFVTVANQFPKCEN